MSDQVKLKESTDELVLFEDGTRIDFEVIKKYINPRLSTQEAYVFLQQCRLFGLNPFKREIYAVKYKDDEPASFVVGYEAFLRRASRVLALDGWKAEVEGEPPNMTAKLTIWRKDWKQPFEHQVFYEEYVQMKYDHATRQMVPNKFWTKMPRTMLRKVVIAQGFRMCFPEDLAGMPYIVDEMPVDQDRLPVEQIKIEAKELKPESKPETLKAEPEDKKAGDAPSSPPAPKETKPAVPEVKPVEAKPEVKPVKVKTLGKKTKDGEPITPKAPTNAKLYSKIKGDPAWVEAIKSMLETLETKYGRDTHDIVNGKNGILARVQKVAGFKRTRLEELSPQEGEVIIRGLLLSLQQARKEEEELKKAEQSEMFEQPAGSQAPDGGDYDPDPGEGEIA